MYWFRSAGNGVVGVVGIAIRAAPKGDLVNAPTVVNVLDLVLGDAAQVR